MGPVEFCCPRVDLGDSFGRQQHYPNHAVYPFEQGNFSFIKRKEDDLFFCLKKAFPMLSIV
jgi:hypothetical protein